MTFKVGEFAELITTHNVILWRRKVTAVTPRVVTLEDGSRWTHRGFRYGASHHRYAWTDPILRPSRLHQETR